jgi:peptidoglycan biosynthesis protein MviN/MurJ (putative lipid II flippase)
MFLKAGLLSLSLLLASRLLGLLRESALAATFGSTGLGDVAVLMLTLPDWLAGVLASGALSYVLLPYWAQQGAAHAALSQRRVAHWMLAAGVLLAAALCLLRQPAVAWLAAGLSPALRPDGARALVWSALALPAALLAALWSTRLQHERDFIGLYGSNLVVNGLLVAALWMAAQVSQNASAPGDDVLTAVGLGLLAAMVLRLLWMRSRLPLATPVPPAWPGLVAQAMPRTRLWLWAAAAAGLPLALPFVARSLASQGGEGALSTFNYAWKLVELPLVLAIQLVATLSFPAITRAFAEDAARRARAASDADGRPGHGAAAAAVSGAFVLAWTLACAAAAGLLVAAPAVTQLLFGWGRMGPQALVQVATWGAAGAWGLLPQALIAVVLTVLATQGRMRVAVAAYALALGGLLAFGSRAAGDGAQLMRGLNLAFTGVAAVSVSALGAQAWRWLPWRCMAATGAVLSALAWLAPGQSPPGAGTAGGLAIGAGAAGLVLAAAWLSGPDFRLALRR